MINEYQYPNRSVYDPYQVNFLNLELDKGRDSFLHMDDCRKVKIVGLRLLSLVMPACKAGPWWAAGNLGIKSLLHGHKVFPK